MNIIEKYKKDLKVFNNEFSRGFLIGFGYGIIIIVFLYLTNQTKNMLDFLVLGILLVCIAIFMIKREPKKGDKK